MEESEGSNADGPLATPSTLGVTQPSRTLRETRQTPIFHRGHPQACHTPRIISTGPPTNADRGDLGRHPTGMPTTTPSEKAAIEVIPARAPPFWSAPPRTILLLGPSESIFRLLALPRHDSSSSAPQTLALVDTFRNPRIGPPSELPIPTHPLRFTEQYFRPRRIRSLRPTAWSLRPDGTRHLRTCPRPTNPIHVPSR